MGNPSFEEVLRVPLVATPALPIDPTTPVRGTDLFLMLLKVAGADAPAEAELKPDELFVSEQEWQTYRRGRWKGFRRRDAGGLYLIDLEKDSGEKTDVMAENSAR